MRAMARRRLSLALLPCLLLAGCGGATPAAQAPAPVVDSNPAAPVPQNAPVDAGKDCVKAEGKCGGGVCAVTVKNDCGDPVRCELVIAVTCDSQGGTSAANGDDHVTVASHATGEVDAQAGCSGGQILRTEVQKLACK
jgi:hypothetical protein